MTTYTMDGHKVAQINLPRVDDDDPHPSLTLMGDRIPSGYGFRAWLPTGWTDISVEMRWEVTGPGCWYVPGYPGVCPIGLWVQV